MQIADTHNMVADSPQVCVLARTYGAQLGYVPIFLLSLWHSGLPNLRVFLLNTDVSMKTSEMRQSTSLVNLIVGRKDFAQFLDFPLHPPGDYGYGLTDDTLEWFYHGAGASEGCEYLVITNGDNVYAQGFGNFLRPAFEHKVDLLGWDFISHHTWFGPTLEFKDNKNYVASEGRNMPISVQFAINHIDLGAAMFRLDFLRQHNLTFLNTGGYGWVSDGQFITKANELANTTFLQHSTLLLHQ